METWIITTFVFFLIGVAIMRWAFRINDIVSRLDKLIELAERSSAKAITATDTHEDVNAAFQKVMAERTDGLRGWGSPPGGRHE